MGCLIEQYAGAFPVWLAPVQVKVLNISGEAEGVRRFFNRQVRRRGNTCRFGLQKRENRLQNKRPSWKGTIYDRDRR